MKRQYSKPMFSVERYALTQTVASCSGIKIGIDPSKTIQQNILADPDATMSMKNWARIGGFINLSECRISLAYRTNTDDGTCYHTNNNGGFNS